jgi:hypothetical protein
MTSAFLITLCLLLIVVFRDDILGTSMRFEPVPDQYPIVYPLEPIMDNYANIIQAIDSCTDKKSLNAAYVRILIFEGCYLDAASFTSELIDFYNAKEIELKSHSC